MSSFYTEIELNKLGLKDFGKNVFISKKCSIYGADKVSIGSNVRIDDFCIISGEVVIGNYVHISAYSALYGKAGIKIGNFCGISPRSTIYSVSDNFSGEHMISPMVPSDLTCLHQGQVILNDYCQLGANTIVMPSVILEEGAVTGAFTFVTSNLQHWSINCGIPAKFCKKRSSRCKEISKELV